MGRKKSTEGGEPQSIRISPELMERVQFVAAQLGLSVHDTMRMAMKVGLEDLKRCNYDVAGAIVDKAHKAVSYEEKARSAMAAASMTLSEPSEGYATAKPAPKKTAS